MEGHIIWQNTSNSSFSTDRLPESILDFASTLPDSRRRLFLHGRALLAEMVFCIAGVERLPDIHYSKNGRPCFAENTMPDFSVGYTGNFVAVALCTEGYVGIDVEVIRLRSQQSLQFQEGFLSTVEQSWINTHPDSLEAMSQIWTIRRSLLKLPATTPAHATPLRVHPLLGRVNLEDLPQASVFSDIYYNVAWACSHSQNLSSLNVWEKAPNDRLEKKDIIIARARAQISSSFLSFYSV